MPPSVSASGYERPLVSCGKHEIPRTVTIEESLRPGDVTCPTLVPLPEITTFTVADAADAAYRRYERLWRSTPSSRSKKRRPVIRRLLVLFAPLMYLGATARAADDPLQAELVARLGPRANYCAVEILNDVSDPQRGADFRACVVKVRRQSRPYGLKIFRDRTDPG